MDKYYFENIKSSFSNIIGKNIYTCKEICDKTNYYIGAASCQKCEDFITKGKTNKKFWIKCNYQNIKLRKIKISKLNTMKESCDSNLNL